MAQIDGLLITAGYSSRMRDFKPLKLYREIPFVISVIIKLSLVCNTVKVVTGYRAEEIQEEFYTWQNMKEKGWHVKFGISDQRRKQLSEFVQFIHNRDFNKGMFSSLQSGLRNSQSSQWILYHFVDQPHIPVSFYPEFVGQAEEDIQWIQPSYKNKAGHPVLMNNQIFPFITDSSADSNLKQILDQHFFSKKFWNCRYPEILQDFDREEDIPGG